MWVAAMAPANPTPQHQSPRPLAQIIHARANVAGATAADECPTREIRQPEATSCHRRFKLENEPTAAAVTSSFRRRDTASWDLPRRVVGAGPSAAQLARPLSRYPAMQLGTASWGE